MKALIGIIRHFLLVLFEALLVLTVGLLSVSIIVPNFINQNSLTIPSTITKYIPETIVIGNIYDYRFIYLLILELAAVFLLILVVSRDAKKASLMMSFPFMLYGYIFLYAQGMSNVITKDFNADQLYAFQQMSKQIFVFVINLGIKYLIIGGVLFILFVVLALQYLKETYNDRNINKNVEKK